MERALLLTVIRYKGVAADQGIWAEITGRGGIIGRREDSDLVLPDPDRVVSGHHARIDYRSGAFFLQDTSTNGTFLNRATEPLQPGQEVELHHGDEISIGDYVIAVAIGEPFTLEFREVDERNGPDTGEPAPAQHQWFPASESPAPGSPARIPEDYDFFAEEARPPAGPQSPLGEVEPSPGAAEPSPRDESGPSGWPEPAQPAVAEEDQMGRLRSAIHAALKDLRSGRILFNAPERMKLARMERVQVRIAGSMAVAPEDLERGLTGSGRHEIEGIKVGSFMTVRLSGSEFQVVALTHEGQFVPEDGYAQWTWNVTPTGSGRQTLFLAVTVRLKLPPFGEEPIDLPVFERTIDVAVSPLVATRRFIAAHWQWIASAVLFPLAAWVATTFWP